MKNSKQCTEFGENSLQLTSNPLWMCVQNITNLAPNHQLVLIKSDFCSGSVSSVFAFIWKWNRRGGVGVCVCVVVCVSSLAAISLSSSINLTQSLPSLTLWGKTGNRCGVRGVDWLTACPLKTFACRRCEARSKLQSIPGFNCVRHRTKPEVFHKKES